MIISFYMHHQTFGKRTHTLTDTRVTQHLFRGTQGEMFFLRAIPSPPPLKIWHFEFLTVKKCTSPRTLKYSPLLSKPWKTLLVKSVLIQHCTQTHVRTHTHNIKKYMKVKKKKKMKLTVHKELHRKRLFSSLRQLL